MDRLPFPFLSLGFASLLLPALFCLRAAPDTSRRLPATLGALLALLAFSAAAASPLLHPRSHFVDPLLTWFRVDDLNALPIVFYTFLLTILLLIAPKRDLAKTSPSGFLLLCLGTVGSYAATTLPVLTAGWWLTALPFTLGLFGPSPARRLNTVFLCASAAALSAFVWITHSGSIDSASNANSIAFAFLLGAVALRKGLFPFHSWVVSSFEHSPLLPAVFVFNGHLGALLIARTEAAQVHEVIQSALNWLSLAALLTALLSSIRGFAERKPRRMLALLCISQASFILAGLVTANRQGMTGALIHWFVVGVTSTLLVGILRILEVRVMDVANPEGHLGLAVRAPKLAAFFLVAALSLVGLPGTLGYNAEDLLFHGALESHPWLGLFLQAAQAFNAINLLRLYSLLFLGVPEKNVLCIPDALPRERWPATVCVVLLVAGGLFATWIFPLLSGITEDLHPLPEHAAPGHR